MIKFILDKYFEKTKGFYPFFLYCPDKYKDYYLKKRTEAKLGYEFDYHNPHTFNEKVRYLIYNEKTKAKSLLTDKIKVKTYISEKVGSKYIATLYGMWDKYEDIDFSYLPNTFVLKANHSWDRNAFINKKTFDKVVNEGLKKKTRIWLKEDYSYYSLEPQYKYIEPKIFVEKLLPLTQDTYRCDYQIHCFNGEPAFVEVARRSIPSSFYDFDWEILPYTMSNSKVEDIFERPAFLEEMKEVAKTLANGFSYVRIDFLVSTDSVYVLEMTFTPYSAMMPFSNRKMDEELGNMIKIPDKLL